MKIIYYAHSVLNRGGDRVILAHLSSLADAGHQVTIKTGLFKPAFGVDSRITIEKITVPTACGTIMSASFFKSNADCIIATIIPVALPLCLRNKRKVVYFAQEYEEDGYSNILTKFFLRLLSTITLGMFRLKTIAVSSELGQFLRKNFNAQVEVIANGIDHEVFYPDPTAEYFALKGDRRAIVLFGSRQSRKGFDTSLQVAKKVSSHVPIDLWIIGDYAAIEIEGLCCRTFGFLEDHQLRKVLSSCDLFLYPAKREGYGLIVAEAFACKCPVVTTTAIHFAKDGVNALVSEVDDIGDLTAKVVMLLESKELGSSMAQNGYEQVRDMSVKKAATDFERIIAGMPRHL